MFFPIYSTKHNSQSERYLPNALSGKKLCYFMKRHFDRWRKNDKRGWPDIIMTCTALLKPASARKRPEISSSLGESQPIAGIFPPYLGGLWHPVSGTLATCPSRWTAWWLEIGLHCHERRDVFGWATSVWRPYSNSPRVPGCIQPESKGRMIMMMKTMTIIVTMTEPLMTPAMKEGMGQLFNRQLFKL